MLYKFHPSIKAQIDLNLKTLLDSMISIVNDLGKKPDERDASKVESEFKTIDKLMADSFALMVKEPGAKAPPEEVQRKIGDSNKKLDDLLHRMEGVISSFKHKYFLVNTIFLYEKYF